MLGGNPIYPVLLSTDLNETRVFCHEKLGLDILRQNENAIVFRCANTELSVTSSPSGTSDSQTHASWRVDDVAAEVAELRSRGVAAEEYDMPGLKTADGIADIGFGLAAWIVDPHGNTLGILQLRG
jgi:catechol 2,3-dioxygenase-like lactoylglutathione lyase family enzyme